MSKIECVHQEVKQLLDFNIFTVGNQQEAGCRVGQIAEVAWRCPSWIRRDSTHAPQEAPRSCYRSARSIGTIGQSQIKVIIILAFIDNTQLNQQLSTKSCLHLKDLRVNTCMFICWTNLFTDSNTLKVRANAFLLHTPWLDGIFLGKKLREEGFWK